MNSIVLLIVFMAFTIIPSSCESTQTEDMYDDTSIIKAEEIEEKACGKNEVWMECSSCEQECGKEPKPCPRICQPAKCQCPVHKGFRRDEKGNCIFCHNPKQTNTVLSRAV